MRSGLVFVGVVFAAAIVVFLLAVTQFTSDPFIWAARHLDYAAAALIPVIPVAALAAVALPRRPDADETDAAPADVEKPERTERPARQPPTTTTVTAPRPQLRTVAPLPLATSVAAPAEPSPKRAEPTTPGARFSSVEQLAVASVLDRGRSVADVAKTLKVRPATVEMWVARARGDAGASS